MTPDAAVRLGAVALATIVAAGTLAASPPGPVVPHARQAFVMGTRVELQAYANDRPTGLALLEQMLAVIERTDVELSTWRQDSVVSRLNAAAGGGPQALPPQICRLLGDLEGLVDQTAGAFDPAIGPLVTAWDLHGAGRIPGDRDLASARAASGWHRIALDAAACELALPPGASLDVGAFGKGEALDRMRDALPAGTAWLANLGGQLAAASGQGSGGWTADLALPHARMDRAMSVRLVTGSLATSAGSERDLSVNGTRVGHILDPRSGRPATFRGSVTVWAERALMADVLSTALYVMGPDEGLQWADRHGIAVVFLDAAPGGAVHARRSAAFSRRFGDGSSPERAARPQRTMTNAARPESAIGRLSRSAVIPQ